MNGSEFGLCSLTLGLHCLRPINIRLDDLLTVLFSERTANEEFSLIQHSQHLHFPFLQQIRIRGCSAYGSGVEPGQGGQ